MSANRAMRNAENPVCARGADWPVRTWSLLVGIAALVAFAPSIRYDWVGWDDEAYVTTSPLMSAPDGLRLIWASTEAEQYYPLTFTLLRVQYQLWGRDPTGYHLTCVLLHALNAMLLVWTLRRLGVSRGIGITTALLFAVHPMQVMSVAWVAQQKNLLSCSFVLLTILAWERFRGRGELRWYVATVSAFVAALLSKTAVLTLPFLLIAIDTIVLRRRIGLSVLQVLPMILLAAGALALTWLFEQPFVEEQTIPLLSQRILIAGAALWFYVLKLICPIELQPIYPIWAVSAHDWRWWLPLALLLIVSLILWRVREFLSRNVVYGIVHFLVFLFPILGLIPYGNLGVTFVSDHYVYVACIGLFLAFATGVSSVFARHQINRVVPVGLVGVVVLSLFLMSHFYAPTFTDARSMWTYTLKGNPNCFTAHAGLGQSLAMQKDWSSAVSAFRKALQLRPGHIGVRHALGQAQIRNGLLAEGEKTLRSIVNENHDLPGPWADLAHVAERTGRFEEAVLCYQRALDLDPRQANTRIRLAQLYLGLSRIDEAAGQFEAAMRNAPDELWGYLGLATCRRGAGKPGEAVHLLESGLERIPDSVSLLNLLARILATDPDMSVRDGPRAVGLARKAERLTDGSDCLVLDTLAAAYAESGDFSRAAKTAERAAEIADSQGYATTARQLLEIGNLFRESRPLRETSTNVRLR